MQKIIDQLNQLEAALLAEQEALLKAKGRAAVSTYIAQARSALKHAADNLTWELEARSRTAVPAASSTAVPAVQPGVSPEAAPNPRS